MESSPWSGVENAIAQVAVYCFSLAVAHMSWGGGQGGIGCHQKWVKKKKAGLRSLFTLKMFYLTIGSCVTGVGTFFYHKWHQ